MSMEKYATYRIFQNEITKEVKRIALAESDELEKTATANNWKEVASEDEIKEEPTYE